MAIADVSETVLWATTVVDSLGLDRIHSFEPGNEADLYPATNLGPPTYQAAQTNASYVGNFTAYAAAIADAVPGLTQPFFQAFDTSSHFDGSDAYILDVETGFGLGINDAGIVKTVAHHYYQTDGGSAATLETGLMSHSAIAGKLDLFKPAIEYLQANAPDVDYIISEIGNSLNPTHDYSYQAALGSALWQVDFQLYALSIGVRRFNFQQIMHSGFDLWLPQASGDSAPQVFASYYAQPFVADLVGSSGEARVAQLALDDETTSGNWAAYAAYEGDAPVRLAVVNLEYWNSSSSTTERAAQNLTVAVPGGVTSVTVDVLSSPEGAGAGADTITYGGSQWTYESLGLEVAGVRNDTQTLAVEDGQVSVAVYQSSAVLIHLNS